MPSLLHNHDDEDIKDFEYFEDYEDFEEDFEEDDEDDKSQSQMLGKVESGGGPIFKVVLEC